MRMLFDHNIDWRLASSLPGDWEINTTRRKRWDGLDNGELLAVAQQEFDVLLTTDKALYGQQNVPNYDIAVIVLRAYSNRLVDLEPFTADIIKTSGAIEAGQIAWLYVSEKLRASDRRHRRGEFAR
ncbi:MAG TPA: hypothetical protein PLD20_34415 [Blastocatellia bacterium]|nr:hypothetical protein [Blastocatellia bacterium]HMV84147.1 hypothetical protein [Blastocatellia bacterium]HMX25282.1 hypothetical protein [Blastocatellia bacterium]HMY71310.1 hypothetical protein [Blastocatellia bacterium]HMZ23070.1 hypothetical protein [Blastocatellia bacterium]